MIYAYVTQLPHKHCWHQVTPRLGLISKALKTKQTIIAVYAGFESIEAAGKFAVWVTKEWGKDAQFDITTRRSERLNPKHCPFEVKVRRPSIEQLHKLIEIAKARQVNNVVPIREAS